MCGWALPGKGCECPSSIHWIKVTARTLLDQSGRSAARQHQAHVKNRWLRESAQSLRDCLPDILDANELDIAAADGYGLSPAAVDRLAAQ
ncbi:MAG: hypothetical protein U0892_07500 [Pirellulales bacterium]